jgi:hypothetical protein
MITLMQKEVVLIPQMDPHPNLHLQYAEQEIHKIHGASQKLF